MNNADKESLKKSLENERNFNQKTLNEMRKERAEKSRTALNKSNNLSSRLGEISFAVAAALTPVLIITSNNINNKEYLIAGLIIYLLTGSYSVFKSKFSVESEISSFMGMGLETEKDISDINNTINKILWDIDNKDYHKEYVAKREGFLTKSKKIGEKRKDNKMDYSLDIILSGFIVATMTALKSVWVYDENYYWYLFCTVIIILIILACVSTWASNENLVEQIALEDEMNEQNSEYLEWRDKNVFKKAVKK